MIFGGFTFGSEVLLASIPAFYGFAIPGRKTTLSLAEFVRARLPDNPTVGDRIRLEDMELVVRGMHGKQITSIGLELELHGRASPA